MFHYKFGKGFEIFLQPFGVVVIGEKVAQFIAENRYATGFEAHK